jgi:hypothetical protein
VVVPAASIRKVLVKAPSAHGSRSATRRDNGAVRGNDLARADVGGLILGILGTIPREGDEVRADGLRFKVEKMQGRRIASVVVSRVSGAP